MKSYDLIVLGAGIIGLSVAHPDDRAFKIERLTSKQ